MEKKIVFFDIDGTLLDSGKRLPASAKEGIRRLKEEGVFVAIATGRAPFMFKSLREKLGIDSYVSFNGQYVVFENEVIYRNPLPAQKLDLLQQQAEEEGMGIVYMNEMTMKANMDDSIRIKKALGSLKFPHPEYRPDFHHERDIYQALLFCTEDEQKKYTERHSYFKVLRWHEFAADILPTGGSKAEGIKQFMRKAGFQMENVFAFGDGLNDIEMLGAAGCGVAMGNAAEEVKKHADYVTEHVDNEGLYKGLIMAGLIEDVQQP